MISYCYRRIIYFMQMLCFELTFLYLLLCKLVYISETMNLRMYTCKYAYLDIFWNLCMFVCMYTCMYLCICMNIYKLYKSIYISVYVCIYIPDISVHISV